MPSSVDLLLGAEIYGRLLLNDVKKGDDLAPVAQLTTLGWLISGPTSTLQVSSPQPSQIFTCCPDYELHDLVRSFWAQETLPQGKLLSIDDKACEEHFKTTHSRDETGRYVVRLPFKTRPHHFGNSRSIAETMLATMHRRFKANHNLRVLYSEFLNEYLKLGHMCLVTENLDSYSFYLPHHGVLKESSLTTKLRVVFNGSQRTNLGFSLNDCLHSGPKIQTDLIAILLRWRLHQYAFVADIEKMYRQIVVHEEDRKFQCILWSESDLYSPSTYQLTTVTYGLACAPFLAIRTLHQLSYDEGRNYPMAVEVIQNVMYVDDVLSGASTLEKAIQKVHQIDGLLTAGGFLLQKWASNEPEVLASIDQSRQLQSSKIFDGDFLLRALGMSWNPVTDQLIISFQGDGFIGSSSASPTRRTVLSSIARLFDPMGWVSPVLISAKIFLQRLWKIDVGWDDPLPEDLASEWKAFADSFVEAPPLSIPRWAGVSSSSTIELHGFCDASLDALAAVLYLRVLSDNFTAQSFLLLSKTKVAPLKRVTVPRLELSAAYLLSQLVTIACDAFKFENVPIHLWSDSLVALVWIKGDPSRWKEFVGNRVLRIQELQPKAVWRHVAGLENPADIASRGLNPNELATCALWLQGPPWLRSPSVSWPSEAPVISADVDLEERVVVHHASVQEPVMWDLAARYSTYQRLIRVTSWVFRIIKRFGHPRGKAPTALQPLSSDDLQTAHTFWMRKLQQAYFSQEIATLGKGQPLPASSNLARLTPFLDSQGILRIGGRLQQSTLTYSAQHPVILPRSSHLTTLIIRDTHLKTLHGGVQLTLSTLRQQYWNIGGRTSVRSVILRCVKCARMRGRAAQQLIGQLPSFRTIPSRLFLHTGVDYAGPFYLKTKRGRAGSSYKAYLVIFVCFATSAVHLKLASDYTTEGFLAAYRRFVGRRGTCATLRSDCGSNLVGADAELKKLFTATSKDFSHVREILAADKSEWHFNPPSAPHFGGKWEAGVKSVKFHLKRIVGDTLLTFDEFTTLLCSIEGVLNSRPLCPLSDDPMDIAALTPGHFLIGAPLNAIPEPSLLDAKTSRLSRWQHIMQMRDHFWHRWSREYLQRMLSITKWNKEYPSLQSGTLVLLIDERYPPSKWPLARIIETHPGPDGHVRVATIRTASSILKRPVVKLCPLPISRV